MPHRRVWTSLRARVRAQLFWDFGSLPQKRQPHLPADDRTKAQKDRFKKALDLMPNMYGSPLTRVLQIKVRPRIPTVGPFVVRVVVA